MKPRQPEAKCLIQGANSDSHVSPGSYVWLEDESRVYVVLNALSSVT